MKMPTLLLFIFVFFLRFSARRQLDAKLESRLNIKDLEALQDAFMVSEL